MEFSARVEILTEWKATLKKMTKILKALQNIGFVIILLLKVMLKYESRHVIGKYSGATYILNCINPIVFHNFRKNMMHILFCKNFGKFDFKNKF